MSEQVQLTKSDLRRFSLRYMFSSQACWNYETQQSVGGIYAIGPFLEKIYADDPDLLNEKFKAYFQFFNTQTFFGAALLAGCLAIESTKEEGCTETALALRTSLMGPFAGIGDALFGSLPRTILAAMSGYAAVQGDIVTGIITCIFGGALLFFLRWTLIKIGYYKGAEFIAEKKEQLNNVRNAVSILGIMIVGCLIASNVKVTTPLTITIGESVTEVQSVLNKLLPNLLPALTVLAVYKGLDIKKMNTVRMVWIIVIVSMILAMCGIIA